MSLRPDDRSSRTRDRSSTRNRDRSRSNVRAQSPPSVLDYTDRVVPGSFSEASYEVRSPEGSSQTSYSAYQSARGGAPYPPDNRFGPDFGPPSFTSDDRYDRRDVRDDDHDRRRRDRGEDDRRRHDDDSDDGLNYGERRQPSSQYSETISESRPYESDNHRYQPARSNSYKTSVYAPQGVKYAQTPEKVTYSTVPYNTQDDRRPDARRHSSLTYERDSRVLENRPEQHRQASTSYDRDTRIVDITPGPLPRDRKSSSADITRVTRTTSNTLVPTGLEPRMQRLSVSGNRPDVLAMGSGGLPPPSPLLEAYHGTYQSISPMPTAMRLNDDDLDDLTPLEYTKHSKIVEKEKKRVKLYDPEQDARRLAKALNASSVDSETICDILPPLSDDQIWELRKEYKKQVKIQGKGINLSKHLKMKLSGNYGKVVYVTALGRWESEGYWANFFYQSHGSRRELLIESLMGRTNADIRSIKDDFKDKRYNDDLVRCMEKELKMDKFRSAILMALEGRRQEEQDVYPQEYRDRDVEMLHRALRSSGGESAMLEIVVRRSDSHLREILRQYEKMYGENFARVALKKSNNLVGEVIAHILNGVINKPARDALLLRHAIKDIAAHNKDDELRYELLVSRLVRLHWDRLHLMRVKKEYREKYGKYLEEDLEDSTKGDFREFVCELCDVQGPR